MNALCILVLVVSVWSTSATQNVFKAVVRDEATGETLIGAVAIIEGTAMGASTDTTGYIEIGNIPDGSHTVIFSMIGYKRREERLEFPISAAEPLTVMLVPQAEELEPVIILTTRGSRAIADEATRVEAITEEELDEKSNMKPGDIRMLLTESTGIQTQQTSATTANASIRIQGLDGRYTQILKDGFPLYSGFASGLGIMQIPPLDLQQVEVIKGSASTLYGGGAIAGIINLISKTAPKDRELSIHLNGTSAQGYDVNTFYGGNIGVTGLTVFAALNGNSAYDPAGIDLTAIPQFRRVTLNPRVFVSVDERTDVVIGVNTGVEKRLGGDIHYIRGEGDSVHSYFERNRSTRISTQIGLEHSFHQGLRLGVKNSVGLFKRHLETPFSSFDGRQFSTFTEVAVSVFDEEMEWIYGTSLVTERFNEQTAKPPRDYSQTVIGGFLQNTWKAREWLSLESGLRVDVARTAGTFVLPRLSVLLQMASNLSSRVGGGFGYKLPTIFTEEAEQMHFRNILPIDERATLAERSVGGNADVNYRSTLGDVVSLTVNHMFFYTKLDHALILVQSGADWLFVNADGHIDTEGMETNIKLGYANLNLFLGYTLTEARTYFMGKSQELPLTPKHKVNAVLIYEIERRWRVGLEAYYFGPQRLAEGTRGRSYWICGFMAERMWQSISAYINFENFLDVRQTRFGQIYSGTTANPIFKDLFAPVDGFVVNGGIKLRL